jgi:polygalacturonase
MFDVRDLGAVGDGKTYDDDSFERAIDAVAALSTASSPFGDALGDHVCVTNPVGPILFIPQGTYRLSRTLESRPSGHPARGRRHRHCGG